MKRAIVCATTLIGLISGPQLAQANVKAVNKCAGVLSAQALRLVNVKAKLLNACATAVVKCNEQVGDALIDACIAAKAMADKKPCSATVLNPTDVTTKLGKAILYFKNHVDKPCKPSDQGGALINPTYAELANATIGSSQNANFITGGLRGLQLECAEHGFNTALTAWDGATGLRDCLARLAGKAADEQVSRSNKRAFAALMRTGMANLSDPVPIGKVDVSGSVSIRFSTGLVAGIDLTGITATSKMEVSGLGDYLPNIAEVQISQTDTSFSPGTYVAAGTTYLACLAQVGAAYGYVCCDPAGCAGPLGGSNSYLLDQDHDISGNNPGYEGGFAADPSCTSTYPNPFNSFQPPPACLESKTRPAACNVADLGLGASHPFAHFPRCQGGARDNEPCDPALAGSDCPGAAPPYCVSESFAGPLAAPPCRSAVRVTRVPGAWGNGHAMLFANLRLDIHKVSSPIDDLDYGGSCSNGPGDGKPDSYGCDGLPCTADDGTPFSSSLTPLMLTTGAASSTVYDSFMVKSSLCPAAVGRVSSQNVGYAASGYCESDPSVGSVPANGCIDLSQNRPSDYKFVATFPVIDHPAGGDMAISIALDLN